jgi:hypothetical protein
LNDFVEFTAGDIQKTRKTAMLFTLPAFSGMILHLPAGAGSDDLRLPASGGLPRVSEQIEK